MKKHTYLFALIALAMLSGPVLLQGGTARAQIDPFAPPPSVSTSRPSNRPPSVPSSGEVDTTNGFRWTCNDPDGDNLEYDLYFGQSDSVLIYVETVGVPGYPWPEVVLIPGVYHWRIEARDTSGLLTIGPVWSFSVLPGGEILSSECTEQDEPADESSAGASVWNAFAVVPVESTYNPLPSGMEFLTIPSGSFQMGSPSSESGRDSDEKRHLVTVQSFELMTTEVTQGMWEEVMGSNPSYFSGNPNNPVEMVSWNDCQEFIAWLNHADTLYTYRLPTEAEWEYAARAGTTTAYYWGDIMNGAYCWYEDNSNESTHPVGSRIPNVWGLYDMSGNVWEWCEDVYTDNYDNCPTDGSAYTGSGSRRVARGGGWYNDARYCRSADRYDFSPGGGGSFLGFRVARSV